jgi:hypothetical protein
MNQPGSLIAGRSWLDSGNLGLEADIDRFNFSILDFI